MRGSRSTSSRLAPEGARDRGTDRVDGSARDARSGSDERVPPPVARRWAASRSSRARLPCWPGKNCICRNHTSAHPLADPYLTSASSTAPDPIVVLEGPGTVPASANGRGYALLGLTCRRTEARSMRRPDGAKGSHALARRSPLHDKIGRLSFAQRCNVTARSHVHLLHGESRPAGGRSPQITDAVMMLLAVRGAARPGCEGNRLAT